MVASTRMIPADLCLDPSRSNAVLPRGGKYKDCATFRCPLAKGLAQRKRSRPPRTSDCIDGEASWRLTAPRPAGQRRAIERAYAAAGVGARDIGLVEAHGTGTPVGDPLEFGSLARVYGKDGNRCAIGSAKTCVGHTESAAGTVGLIKAILGLTSFDGELKVQGLDPRTERNSLMNEVCFIADVAVLPRWLKVSQALDFVAGVHPRFDRKRAEAKIRKANSEAKSLRERLKELEPLAEKARQLEDAQKSEQERLTEQLTAAQERAAKATRAAVTSKVEALAATKFADPTDPVGELDLASLVDDDGVIDVAGISAALDEVLERKPHWARAESGPRRPVPDRSQGSSGNGNRTHNDPAAEFAGFLNKALQQGR